MSYENNNLLKLANINKLKKIYEPKALDCL